MRTSDLLVQAPLLLALHLMPAAEATATSGTRICRGDRTGTVFRCTGRTRREKGQQAAGVSWSSAVEQLRGARLRIASSDRLAADSPRTLESILASRLGPRATSNKETK
jgi:hypothetical protein